MPPCDRPTITARIGHEGPPAPDKPADGVSNGDGGGLAPTTAVDRGPTMAGGDSLHRVVSALLPDLVRITIHLPPTIRTALKRLAIDRGTTMAALIRNAINTAVGDSTALAAASMPHRRGTGGVRTTLDLARARHRELKIVAADTQTSVQALVVASILQVFPELGPSG